jgi:hypothetical protein
MLFMQTLFVVCHHLCIIRDVALMTAISIERQWDMVDRVLIKEPQPKILILMPQE